MVPKLKAVRKKHIGHRKVKKTLKDCPTNKINIPRTNDLLEK